MAPAFTLLPTTPQPSHTLVTEDVGTGAPLCLCSPPPIPLTFFPLGPGGPSPAASGAVGLKAAPFLPSAHCAQKAEPVTVITCGCGPPLPSPLWPSPCPSSCLQPLHLRPILLVTPGFLCLFLLLSSSLSDPISHCLSPSRSVCVAFPSLSPLPPTLSLSPSSSLTFTLWLSFPPVLGCLSPGFGDSLLACPISLPSDALSLFASLSLLLSLGCFPSPCHS